MKQFLKDIGITEVGYFTEDGNYVIDLENSDAFNKVYGKLDNTDLIEENEDASVVNLDVTNIIYFCDEFAINLIADFTQNEYKIVVTEVEGEED